jgi:hypothetical protein
MPTPCTVSDPDNIATGDAVCLTDWDSGNNRPKVARATVANLAKSKTVFGICNQGAKDGDLVDILVAGEVAPQSITNLKNGAGTSKLVVTKYDDGDPKNQAMLRHIDDPPPVGERFVVGTSDENGNLAIQPRHDSGETGFLKVFNVRAYGATGDGVTPDENAIQNAINAVTAAGGGRLFFPPGTYSIGTGTNLTMPPKVQVQFEEGAVLAPNRAAVTIQGRITCHPLQRVFGGTGYSTAVRPDSPSSTALSVGGNPFGNYTFNLRITKSGNVGGPPPVPNFEYSLDGVTWSTERTAAATYELEGTGLTITFNPGGYNLDYAHTKYGSPME